MSINDSPKIDSPTLALLAQKYPAEFSGESAFYYSKDLGSGYICICGHSNSGPLVQSCQKCSKPKDRVLAFFSKEAVDSLMNLDREHKRINKELQEFKILVSSRDKAQKSKHRVKIALLTLAAVFAAFGILGMEQVWYF